MTSTRNRILDATLAVAAERGLAAMSLESVAHQAGVSRQTVYRHFGGREALVKAVILREEQSFIEAAIDATEGHTELRPAIEAALTELLRAARAHPLLDHLLEREPEGLLPYLLDGSGPVLAAARPVLENLLGEWATGLTESELHRIADVAMRLIVSYTVTPTDEPPEVVAIDLADFIVARLKGADA